MDREQMRQKLREKINNKKLTRTSKVVLESKLEEEKSKSDNGFEPETFEMLNKLSNNPEVKNIVDNVSKNPELMNYITKQIENPDSLKEVIEQMSKNKSLFNESLLTDPEILKKASDPDVIRTALNAFKDNPDFFKNFKM